MSEHSSPHSQQPQPQPNGMRRNVARDPQPRRNVARDPQPRRTTARDWIPDQPGAWVMALAPALAGAVCGSVWSAAKPDAAVNAAGWWVLLCWALCYCVEFTAARWLKSHGASRFLPPVVGYTTALVCAGIPFLIMHIDVLIWAPLYMVLAAAAFAGAWFRRERSLWANAAAVIAASVMAMITFHYAANSPDIPQVSLPGLVLVLCFAATQFGSVLFVKTMIRERGKHSYVAASWIWHIALLAWWIAAAGHSWYLVILGVILFSRAVALPLIARRHTIKPVIVGITECCTSVMAFGCIIANALAYL